MNQENTENTENKGFYTDESRIPPPINSNPPQRKNDSNLFLGALIIIIGLGLLLRNTNIFQGYFFERIVSFPTFLLIGSLIWGYKENFKFGIWSFMAAAGLYFLVLKFSNTAAGFVLPVVLIGVGFLLIQRNKTRKIGGYKDSQSNEYSQTGTSSVISENVPENAFANRDFAQGDFSKGDYRAEFVNITAVFSENKRVISSQNFKGGKLVAIFGGSKLDCRGGNIQEDIVLDIATVFGGTELIFPANWIVVNEMTTLFGAVEDKRRLLNSTGNEHRVILTGFTLFGSVEIKNH